MGKKDNRSSKANDKRSCNPYLGGVIPPCYQFLGNDNPIIKDGRLIYKNHNRLFLFLSTSYENEASVNTNIQISLCSFIIGLFVNQVQNGIIKYDENCIIHTNKKINSLIHKLLQAPPDVKMSCKPFLSIYISHRDAVTALYNSSIPIAPFNYYLLFILNRLEGNPGLFFSNNSFVTPDPINFDLSSFNLNFPFKEK